MRKLPLRVPLVSRMGDLPRAPGGERPRSAAWRPAWRLARLGATLLEHGSTDAAPSQPPGARPRPGRPRRELLARRNAAPVRGTRERSERSEGSGAAHIARHFWSGWRRERRRWRVPIHGRAFDRSGGNCPRVASFASFAARVHVHSARRSTAARTGRAQRRVRSFRARRLVLPPPLGSISGGAMRTPLSVAPPVVYIS